jgi:hypothetical protein
MPGGIVVAVAVAVAWTVDFTEPAWACSPYGKSEKIAFPRWRSVTLGLLKWIMRRFLPRWFELLLFAVLAVGLAAVVNRFCAQEPGLGMAGFGAPMFLLAAMMGLRRSPLWTHEQSRRDRKDR